MGMIYSVTNSVVYVAVSRSGDRSADLLPRYYDVMANIIITRKCLNIFKKYNCYIIYYAYGIIKVKYIESLLTILFFCLLFFFYNDYNNKMYLILSYFNIARRSNFPCYKITS